MRQVAEWYQRMRRGGLTCRNWLRLEYAAGNWDAAVESARGSGSGAAVECHPVSNPTEGEVEEPIEDDRETRCGAQTIQRKEAFEVSTRTRTTQEQLDSKMRYAKTTHKIEILTKSLSDGTRAVYRRSWKRWVLFFRGQCRPAWLDSREERLDEHVANFILSERDVLGLKASAIRRKSAEYDFSYRQR